MKKAFTLVELLIVIALIAILSVGVLATINPVEQRNKATDATTSNDAGEVLNAYERYYTNSSIYPWMATNNLIMADDLFGTLSNRVGFGLCTNALGTGLEQTACTDYKASGSLISSDELKDSFLEKGYSKVVGTAVGQITFDKLLYLLKQDATTGHNSIYVCYIPKAKSNRTSASNLKKLTFGTVNGITGTPTALADTVAADFDPDGSPADATWTFEDAATSLFKCVP